MARLIDDSDVYALFETSGFARLHVSDIDTIPRVDAVEVVHGRLEDMWDGKYANPRYRCSVCKEKANYKSVQDGLLSWHDVQVLTPYCPYCMAKLDGGIDNDIKAV